MKTICENCKYYFEFVYGRGSCKRFPPTKESGSGFVSTSCGDWCGEYKKKVGQK